MFKAKQMDNYNASSEGMLFSDILSIFRIYKIFIITLTLFITILVSFYALKIPKKYEASTLFMLDLSGKKNASLNDGSQISFASLINNDGANPLMALKEEVKHNVFIEKMIATAGLNTDTYFNTYNPDSVEPKWKTSIKKLLNYQTNTTSINNRKIDSIKNSYRNNISLDITEAKNLSIKVQHGDAHRAAIIANLIMKQIISDTAQRSNKRAADEVRYLSQELANALYEVEDIKEKLNEFTINNTLFPLEAFSKGSLNLEEKKLQFDNTKELFQAVEMISDYINSNKFSKKDYEIIKNQHPIIDQVEFRRIFGQNEIVNNWIWPSKETALIVLKTLNQRMKTLQTEVDIARDELKRLSNNLQIYQTLKTNAKFAEATYTVLLEQVKATSLQSGYQPSQAEVYEYATTPSFASLPNVKFITFISGFLAFIFSLCLSILMFTQKGIYPSIKKLIYSNSNNYTNSYKVLQSLRKKPSDQIKKIYEKKSFAILRELIIEINNADKKIILVTNLKSKIHSHQFSNILSSRFLQEGLSVAVIDFSKNKKNNKLQLYENNDYYIVRSQNNFIELKPNIKRDTVEFLSNKAANSKIIDLSSSFDVLILAADFDESKSLIKVLDQKYIYQITLVKQTVTKINDLKQIIGKNISGAVLYD
jgi:uncharacterized protein involved in exopolysaccharide biosynthesis